MKKAKPLYFISLGFLAVTLVFVSLLVFIQIREGKTTYVLASRVFSQGIAALFFYLAYTFGVATLTLSILSIFKDKHFLRRSSFFLKVYFVMILVTPFFTGIYYEYSHESSFFVMDVLAVEFLLISVVLEGFAIKIIEDNTPRDKLVNDYLIVINSDYFLLLVSGLIIIILSFVFGDFYAFSNDYLVNIPIYFIPLTSLLFYIFNSSKLNYLNSQYFSPLNVIKSRFAYYFIAYITIVRLGYYAYSEHSFFEGLKILRLVLFLVFISIVIFNSFLPKIDLSFGLAIISLTLLIFEMIGLVQLLQAEERYVYYIAVFALDYLIVLFISVPYYIYTGIDKFFFNRKHN